MSLLARLQVFSGKEARLNRVILKTLEWKSPLIATNEQLAKFIDLF